MYHGSSCYRVSYNIYLQEPVIDFPSINPRVICHSLLKILLYDMKHHM